jgi:hypothetical protein
MVKWDSATVVVIALVGKEQMEKWDSATVARDAKGKNKKFM